MPLRSAWSRSSRQLCACAALCHISDLWLPLRASITSVSLKTGSPVTPRDHRTRGGGEETPSPPAAAPGSALAAPVAREAQSEATGATAGAALLAGSYQALTQLLAAADSNPGTAEAPSSPGACGKAERALRQVALRTWHATYDARHGSLALSSLTVCSVGDGCATGQLLELHHVPRWTQTRLWGDPESLVHRKELIF